MPVGNVHMERISIVSARPFDKVVEAIRFEPLLDGLTWSSSRRQPKSARTFAELEASVQKGLGRTNLMLFMELDHGGILQKESGQSAPKIVRLIVGNPLIMKEMVKHVPDAGSYAPVTILIDERPDGVHLSYDRMASLLAPYGNSAALTVARDLDSKVESLLRESAA